MELGWQSGGVVTRPPFVMVRRDFLDALDVLSDNEVRVGVALCRFADRETAVWSGTLAQLERLCSWEKSASTLRRSLASLREGGWLTYEIAERQREPYVVRLTGLSVADCIIELPSNDAVVTQLSASSSAPSSVSSTASNRVVTLDSELSQLGQELRHLTASTPSNSCLSRREQTAVGKGSELAEAEKTDFGARVSDFLSDIERARLFDELYPPKRTTAAA